MTTSARHLPIHGECHHDHHATAVERDAALAQLADVWAALNRARTTGLAGPAGAGELIDQLAADRDQAHAALGDAQELIATLDDAVERIDRARARYATRPGSRPSGAQDTVPPAESHAQPPVDPGAGDAEGGTTPTAHSGPEDPEAGLRTGGTLPNGGTVVLGQDDSGCVIAPDAARHRAGDLAGHKVVVTRLHYDGLGALRSGDSAGSVVSRQRVPAGALRELLDLLAAIRLGLSARTVQRRRADRTRT